VLSRLRQEIGLARRRGDDVGIHREARPTSVGDFRGLYIGRVRHNDEIHTTAGSLTSACARSASIATTSWTSTSAPRACVTRFCEGRVSPEKTAARPWNSTRYPSAGRTGPWSTRKLEIIRPSVVR
jgi:hypothetical protein